MIPPWYGARVLTASRLMVACLVALVWAGCGPPPAHTSAHSERHSHPHCHGDECHTHRHGAGHH